MCSALSVINTYYEVAYQLLSGGQALMTEWQCGDMKRDLKKEYKRKRKQTLKEAFTEAKMCQTEKL